MKKIKLELNKKKIAILNHTQTKKIKGGKTLMTCNFTTTIDGISIKVCGDTVEAKLSVMTC